MAQTGVPFGEIAVVRDWMGLSGDVGKPRVEHPKRPITGLDCPRSEVSGRRLWGWAADRFGTPEAFFERFFVLNYCPLSFMEGPTGRNRIPEKLPKEERAPLFAACDTALRALVDELQPQYIVGVGAFAEKCAKRVLGPDTDVTIGRMLHPSPASPKANRGWAPQAEADLVALGLSF
jgi:single-strand selective monofunctional uracil DNA glycosylase